MSNLNNESFKKSDQDSLTNAIDIDNEDKSYNGDNCCHETLNKKRKLIGPKTKSGKRTRLHNCGTTGNSDLEQTTTTSTAKDLDSDSSSHKQVSGRGSSPMQIGTSSATIAVHDIYCWICLKTENTIQCRFCPRSFHGNCVQNCFSKSQIESDKDDLICPECISLMVSECTVNIAPKLRTMPAQQLNEMLLFILMRLYHISGSSHFQVPVDDQTIKDYYTIIKHPVYLDMLKEKVMNNEYHSVQAFHSDFKWILHNCSVYNGVTSVLTNYAKNIDKVCMKEINFLRSCPECFQQRMPYMIKFLKDQSKNSPTKVSIADRGWEFSVDNDGQSVNEMWMTKLCSLVHCLVWVRLHNYPVWPGKLISLDDESALVLFFGDYDLNIVPLGSICIHTQSNHKRLVTNIASFANRRASAPVPSANSVSKEYQLALDQLNIHLANIKKRYEFFVIPPKKIEFNISAGVDYYDTIRLHHHNHDHQQNQLQPDVSHHSSSSLSPTAPPSLSSIVSANNGCVGNTTGVGGVSGGSELNAPPPSLPPIINSNNSNNSNNNNSNSKTERGILSKNRSIQINNDDNNNNNDYDDDDDDDNVSPRLLMMDDGVRKRRGLLKDLMKNVHESSGSSLSASQLLNTSLISDNDAPRVRRMADNQLKYYKTAKLDRLSRIPARLLQSLEVGMQSLIRQLKSQYLLTQPDDSHPTRTHLQLKKKDRQSIGAASADGERNNDGQQYWNKAENTDEKTIEDEDDEAEQLTEKEDLEEDMDWRLERKLKRCRRVKDFQQQTDPTISTVTSMVNVSVQSDHLHHDQDQDQLDRTKDRDREKEKDKDKDKEDELRKYAKYLEKCLVSAEIEIRRQEILSALHHEESLLEFSKQQKEMKKIYDNDVLDIIRLLKAKIEENVGRTIQKVKLNEWCAFCSKLARFYCCWNTCYCNHECQSKHWDLHKATCTQINRSAIVQPGVVIQKTITTAASNGNAITVTNSSCSLFPHHPAPGPPGSCSGFLTSSSASSSCSSSSSSTSFSSSTNLTALSHSIPPTISTSSIIGTSAGGGGSMGIFGGSGTSAGVGLSGINIASVMIQQQQHPLGQHRNGGEHIDLSNGGGLGLGIGGLPSTADYVSANVDFVF